MSIHEDEALSDFKKIRILVITNSLPREKMGGNPTIVDQLEELVRREGDIDLVSIEAGNIISYLGALWIILKLNFARKKYDLIHAYYGHCGLLARMQIRYPVVVTFLGSDIVGKDRNGWHDRLIGRAVSRLVDESVVMSEDMARYVPRHNSHIIPFGVNTNLFFPKEKTQARKVLGLPVDEKVILFPWNPARKEKRFEIVQAATDILKQHYPVKLLAVFEKPHQALAMHMNACDVLILASEHEGSPLAVREALACNLPVVSVNVGDVAQVIEGVENCFLTSDDPIEMANKVEQIFKNGRRSTGSSKVNLMNIQWSADKVYGIYERLSSK